MLAVAERLDDEVDWRAGTAEALPCEGGTFDRVVSQFGMMFFTDRVGAIKEVVRVLGPSGRFAIAVWDSLENCPAYAVEVELLERMAGREAADALRAPFVLGQRDELVRVVEEGGGAALEASTLVGRARFPSVRSMVEADLRGWLPVMGVDLEEDLILSVLAAADQELASFVHPDGRVQFDAPAHLVSGTKGA